MKFKKAIVSAGPTREWIDPVRFISNASSGKMGYFLALELSKKIPEVVYIRGNVVERYAKLKKGKTISVESTNEMKNAVLSELKDSTLLVMAAAPADFRPAKMEKHKIKKISKEHTIVLKKNPDILVACKKKIHLERLAKTKMVGFAAETKKLQENAKEKLTKKGLSFIIGNYVHSNQKGFGEKKTSVKIFSKKGIEAEFKNQEKDKIAQSICDFLLKNL